MNALAIAVYAARVGDALNEAKDDLTEAEYEQVLDLAAAAVSRRVADQIEQWWMGR